VGSRYNKWTKDGVLSFIPPDGKFRLLDYEASSSKAQLPLQLKAGMTIEENGGQLPCIHPHFELMGSRSVLADIDISVKSTANRGYRNIHIPRRRCYFG
jgi:hypothetical protein